AGAYYLCAAGVADVHLGSCEWTHGPKQVEVASGQTVREVSLQIAEGCKLTFWVDDLKGLIRDPADSPGPAGRMQFTGANFRIGIMAGTRYARARLVSAGAGTRTYQMLIPK